MSKELDETLELERIKKQLFGYFKSTGVSTNFINDYEELIFEPIKQALIKAQEQEKFFDDKLVFKNGCIMSGFDYKGKQIVAMPLEEYDEFMKQKKAQEPKQYLKWEDLEFKIENQEMFVLLNGSFYLLEYYTDSETEYVIIKATNTTMFALEGDWIDDIQFFNDLHLERVEE